MKMVAEFLQGSMTERVADDRKPCRIAELHISSKRAVSRIKVVTILVLCLLLLGGLDRLQIGWAAEEGYPSKPVKILIPFNPGSHSDLTARISQDYLSQELKVPVTVENRSGAGGLIGAGEVFRGKADGYTILGCGDAVMTVVPLSNPNPPFDPLNDFLPICSQGINPFAFAVQKSSPFKNLAQFVEAAKAKPGQLTVGLPSMGGVNQMVWEVFKTSAGISVKLVPQKGAPETATGLLGKHLDMGVLSYASLISYLKSGELRLLATTFRVRGSTAQTVAEAGYPKTIHSRSIYLVQAKTPRPIYERLVTAFERISKINELNEKLQAIGLSTEYEGPAEIQTLLRKNTIENKAFLKELGFLK